MAKKRVKVPVRKPYALNQKGGAIESRQAKAKRSLRKAAKVSLKRQEEFYW